MVSLDRFPYLQKQTRSNEFIPCSKDVCDILTRFRIFKTPAISLICAKSPYKCSVTGSHRSGKENGRRSGSPLWRHQRRSFPFISHHDDVRRKIPVYTSWLSLYLYFMVLSQSEARVSTEHGIYMYIVISCGWFTMSMKVQQYIYLCTVTHRNCWNRSSFIL